MQKIIYGLLMLIMITSLTGSGCSGGISADYQGSGIPTAAATTMVSTRTTASTPSEASTPSAASTTITAVTSLVPFSSTRGYVYVFSPAESSAASAAGTSTEQLILLPSNSMQPADCVPAAGYTVRSSTNPSLSTVTDLQGYFTLDPQASSDLSPACIGDGIIIEDPDSIAPPAAYPVLGEPMALSELTEVKIVPSFNRTGRSWPVAAGTCEGFFLAGRSGDYWHPVSDAVTWTISDGTLGSFVGGWSLFRASSTLTASTTGTIMAACGSTTCTESIQVIVTGDCGSLEGCIRDEKGNPASRVIVDAIMTAVPSPVPTPTAAAPATTPALPPDSPNLPYFPGYAPHMAITDSLGYYRLNSLPRGTYNVTVRSSRGSDLAESPVTVYGAATQGFTISSLSMWVYGKVTTDLPTCKPGGTLSGRIALANGGSSQADISFSSITLRLIYHRKSGNSSPLPASGGSMPDGTVIATAITAGTTVSVASKGKSVVPADALSLVVPDNAPADGSYTMDGIITTSPSFRIEPAQVIVTGPANAASSPTPAPSPSTSL